MSQADEIRKVLEKSGYKDIPPELLNDFIKALKEEEEEETNEGIEDEDEEEEEIQEFRPLKRNIPRKTASPPKKQTQKQSKPSSPVRKQPSPQKQTTEKKSPVKQTRKRSEDLEIDEETDSFEQRIKALKEKAASLDETLQQCRDVVLSPPEDGPDEVDVPLYAGTSERKLDPYPTVKKQYVGGFIRPPPVKPSKRPVGASKKKGRRLLYEERHPESSYVPPPERRRDALRWSIRQKLIYSHPDYQ